MSSVATNSTTLQGTLGSGGIQPAAGGGGDASMQAFVRKLLDKVQSSANIGDIWTVDNTHAALRQLSPQQILSSHEFTVDNAVNALKQGVLGGDLGTDPSAMAAKGLEASGALSHGQAAFAAFAGKMQQDAERLGKYSLDMHAAMATIEGDLSVPESQKVALRGLMHRIDKAKQEADDLAVLAMYLMLGLAPPGDLVTRLRDAGKGAIVDELVRSAALVNLSSSMNPAAAQAMEQMGFGGIPGVAQMIKNGKSIDNKARALTDNGLVRPVAKPGEVPSSLPPSMGGANGTGAYAAANASVRPPELVAATYAKTRQPVRG